MLEDRDYMRQPEYLPRVSMTVLLLAANVVVFIIECFALGYPPRFSLSNPFALSVEGLRHGFVWQLLTYQFMNASLWHIIANSWLIYLFGREMRRPSATSNFWCCIWSVALSGGFFRRWPRCCGRVFLAARWWARPRAGWG